LIVSNPPFDPFKCTFSVYRGSNASSFLSTWSAWVTQTSWNWETSSPLPPHESPLQPMIVMHLESLEVKGFLMQYISKNLFFTCVVSLPISENVLLTSAQVTNALLRSSESEWNECAIGSYLSCWLLRPYIDFFSLHSMCRVSTWDSNVCSVDLDFNQTYPKPTENWISPTLQTIIIQGWGYNLCEVSSHSPVFGHTNTSQTQRTGDGSGVTPLGISWLWPCHPPFFEL
jgi:hypothetical protein